VVSIIRQKVPQISTVQQTRKNKYYSEEGVGFEGNLET
jgi:hypothetical protein